ncbi:MAG TPA: hypothetical protein VHH36_08600 [Candidatus Thermoplasmatota archaeon]|nr:hypothetical protein [Candidatus Thermoplasmatota archaeon]
MMRTPHDHEAFLLDTLADRRYPGETRRFFRLENVDPPGDPPKGDGWWARLRGRAALRAWRRALKAP